MTDYERYLGKVQKLSGKVKTLKKVLTVVSVFLGVLAAAAVFCTVMKGRFIQKLTCEDIIYGDEVRPASRAFLSPVSYRFCPQGSEEWSEEAPATPGTYTVMAVAETAFGKDSVQTVDFTIQKRPVTLSFANREITFGSSLSFREVIDNLAFSDQVSVEMFPQWASIPVGANQLTPSADDIRFFSGEGQDVSAYYTIAEIAPIEVNVLAREITVSMKASEFEYDGMSHRSTEGKVQSGSLAAGHSVEVVSNEELTDLGTIAARVAQVRIVDGQNRDVSFGYDITLEVSTLSVVPRKVSIKLADASKVYDGTALKNSKYEITKGSLLPGDSLRIVTEGSITYAGTAENTVSSWSVKKGSTDRSKYYDIIVTPGTLTVEKRKLTVKTPSGTWVYDGKYHSLLDSVQIIGSRAPGDGDYSIVGYRDIIDVGSVSNEITDFNIYRSGSWTDVTGSYDITFDFGTLTVTPRKITIKASLDSDCIYTGQPFSEAKGTVISGSLASGHVLEGQVTSFIKNPGTYDVSYSFLVKNGKGVLGTDVTQNYSITVVSDKTVIKKRSITLESESRTQEFDFDKELKYDVVKTSYLQENGFALQTGSWATLSEIGKCQNSFQVERITKDGEDVTDFFNIQYKYGTLEVTKRNVAVTSKDDSKVYDGTPLTNHDMTITLGSLLSGHSLQMEYSGSQTEVGESPNKCTGRITDDATGQDVTDRYYVLEIKFGTLEVTEEEGCDCPQPEGLSLSDVPFEPSNDPVFKIKSDSSGTVYVKEYSLGDYDGFSSWSTAEVYKHSYSLNPGQYAAAWAVKSGFVKHSAQIGSIDGEEFSHLYVPYYSVQYDSYQKNDVSASFTGSNIYEYEYYNPSLADFLAYNSSSAILGSLSAEEKNYESFVRSHYLAVPNDTRQVLEELAKNAGLNAASPTIITDVQKYIKHAASYNLRFQEFPKGVDMVVYFLTESREGICQHYAAAATLMYRTLGIPARFTVGYLAQTQAGQWKEVTGKTAHAWTEVYISGAGWVKVEVTGSSAEGEIDDPGDSSDASEVELSPFAAQQNSDSFDRSQLEVDAQIGSISGWDIGEEIEPDKALNLLPGDTMVVVPGEADGDGSGGTAGEKGVTCLSFKIYDSNGNDVTSQYKSVEVKNGVATVEPVVITLPEEFGVVGMLESDVYYDIIPSDIPVDLHQYIMLRSDNPQVHIDGTKIWVSEPGEYSVSFATGTIDINGDYIIDYTLTGDNAKLYCYSFSNVEQMSITPEEAVSRGILDMAYQGISQTVTDMQGNEYNVLSIQMGSKSAQYDGSIIECDDYTILTGKLSDGDQLIIKGTGSARFTGEYPNIFTLLRVVDRDGRDVTSSYLVKVYSGTITVTTATLEKTAQKTLMPGASFRKDDFLKELWSNQLKWTLSLETGAELFVQRDDAFCAKKVGDARMNAVGEIDLNGDGVPEYYLSTVINISIRVPVVAIVIAAAMLLIPSTLFIVKTVKRRKRIQHWK